MGRQVAQLIAVLAVAGAVLSWYLFGGAREDGVRRSQATGNAEPAARAGAHDPAGVSGKAHALRPGAREPHDAVADASQGGTGSLRALAAELQEKAARADACGATPEESAWDPGITSADIPTTNGAYYFMLASESISPELMDLFSGKFLELEERAWTDPEIRAHWDEIQNILALVRQGLELGNAQLPPVLSPNEELPYLARWRMMGRMLTVEADFLQSQGNYAAAAQSYLDTIAFANQFTLGGTLIGGLVGYAVTGFGTDGLQQQMRDGVIPPAEYAAILAELERLGANTPGQQELQQYEAAVFDPWLVSELQSAADVRTYLDEQVRELVPEESWVDSLLTLDDSELQRVFAEYLEHRQFVVEYTARPLYQMDPADLAMLESNPLSRMLIAPPIRIAEAEARVQTHLEGAALMAAIEQYAYESGAYPSSLDTLFPEFLSRPPAPDPFSGAPFVYFPEGNNYVLYSVGNDRTDNGGVPSHNVRDPNTDIVLHGRVAPPEPELPPGGSLP